MPDVTAAVYSVIDRSSGYTWATLPAGIGTWTNWGTYWTGQSVSWTFWTEPVDGFASNESLILAGPQNLWEMDRTNQANGVNIECIARRTHLDAGDQQDWHTVLTIYPRMQGDPVDIRVGYHEHINDAETWADYQTFDPSTDYKLDFRVSGRLHAIEYRSEDDVSWTSDGYETDFVFGGNR